MIVALDANIVIYLIEANPVWSPIATARLAAMRNAGDVVAFCEAGRLERLVKPFASDNATDIATYQSFFSSPHVTMLPVTAAAWDGAARIAASSNLRPLDCVHLATAIEHGCGIFLTNDKKLQRCTEITVEVLS